MSIKDFIILNKLGTIDSKSRRRSILFSFQSVKNCRSSTLRLKESETCQFVPEINRKCFKWSQNFGLHLCGQYCQLQGGFPRRTKFMVTQFLSKYYHGICWRWRFVPENRWSQEKENSIPISWNMECSHSSL